MAITRAQAQEIHERCLQLIHEKKLDEAAQLADTIAELVADPSNDIVHWHGADYIDHHWGMGEILGNHDRRRNPERAIRMYRMALATYRIHAMHATSGSEGSARMYDVERLERIIETLQNPRPWWRFWA